MPKCWMPIFYYLLLALKINGYQVKRIWYEGGANATGNFTFGIPLTVESDDDTYLKWGPIVKNTMDMWVWWVNQERGGIKIGDAVYLAEVKYMNDWGNADHVTNVTKFLIETEGVDFMFAPYSTTLTKPAAVVCEEAKVLIMAGAASSSGIFAGKKYLYSPQTSSGSLMKAGIKTLVLRGAETIVKINQARGFTSSMCATLNDYANELAESTKTDVRIIYETELSAFPEEAEIDSLLWNLTHLVTEHVDISIGCVYYDICTLMIQKAKEYRYEPDAMIFSICIDNSNFITDIGKDDARYMIGAVLWHEDMVLTGDLTGWSAKDYADIYRQRYANATPPYQSASYFAGGLAYVQAIENTASIDSDEVAYALSRLDIDTFYGTIKFDSLNQGSTDFSYGQYDEEGNFKIVIPDSVATGSLIHPMPTWTYRQCILDHGEDSCLCWEEGCPRCTLEDYNFSVTSCSSKLEARWVQYSLTKDCLNGTALPDSVALECDHVPFGSATSTAIQVLAYFGLAIGMFFFLWTWVLRKTKVIKAAQPQFCYLVALGGSLSAFSPYFSLGPNTEWKCEVRPLVFHLPFTLMIGSLFVKAFRVWRIFGNAKLIKVKYTVKDTFKLLGVVLMVTVVLLAIWFIIDTPSSENSFVSITNIGDVPATTCHYFDTFTTVIVVYEVGLVGIACYFSFMNRKVADTFSETRYVFFAIYSIALILGMTSLVAAMDVPISVEILMRGIGTSISCTLSLCVLFVPKIVLYMTVDELKFDVTTTSMRNLRVGEPGGKATTTDNGRPSSIQSGPKLVQPKSPPTYQRSNQYFDKLCEDGEKEDHFEQALLLIDLLNQKLRKCDQDPITLEQFCKADPITQKV